MDKNYVKQVIEGLGGAKALMDEMDEYHEIVARMRKERPSLVGEAPRQVGGDGTGGSFSHRRLHG